MDLATMVMVSITGFAPGQHLRAVATFPFSDMAKCRAEVAQYRPFPLDKSRSYFLCLPVSERMIGRHGVKRWDNIKFWVTRDMLDRCACVPSAVGNKIARVDLVERNVLRAAF